MLYALAGIPLGLVMFQAIGERMNTFAAKIVRNVKRCFGRHPSVTHIDLIVICTALSLIIIFAGAAVFRGYENWYVQGERLELAPLSAGVITTQSTTDFRQ